MVRKFSDDFQALSISEMAALVQGIRNSLARNYSVFTGTFAKSAVVGVQKCNHYVKNTPQKAFIPINSVSYPQSFDYLSVFLF